MKKTDIGFYALLGCTLAGILYLIGFVFLVVPPAQVQAGGVSQKILYFHAPSAYGMYLSAVACFFGSAAYLLKPTDKRNALAEAGAECAVVFGLIVLTTGPLWAKKAWGVYWTWDPRLTVSLLNVLIYVAIVVLRAFAGDGHAERKFAAALGVLGTVNLPIIHYAVKKWGGTHPIVIQKGGGGLGHPDMVKALVAGFIMLTLFAVVLLWVRTVYCYNRARLRALEEQALQEGVLEG